MSGMLKSQVNQNQPVRTAVVLSPSEAANMVRTLSEINSLVAAMTESREIGPGGIRVCHRAIDETSSMIIRLGGKPLKWAPKTRK